MEQILFTKEQIESRVKELGKENFSLLQIYS